VGLLETGYLRIRNMEKPVQQLAWYITLLCISDHNVLFYCNSPKIIDYFQGMILLWDTDSGLAQLDKYLHSNDTHVVAGALLGIGVVTCGVKNDCDPVCIPLH
jgi:hypothetical protein